MKMKDKRSTITNFIFLFLGIIITVAIIYFFRDNLISLFPNGSNSNGTCYTQCENKISITENSISDAVDKIYDAVVLIKNYNNNKLSASGTGFVYKIDSNYGYILTNYHVIDGNTSLKVVLSNEEEITATYIGGDNYLDIAVLTIPKDNVLKVAEIGNSKNTKLGDTVFTIGSPVDIQYMGTVTKGILSGKDRLVSVTANNVEYIMNVIQTDAAMNPGNSGGPLVNINGQVIGMNSLKLVQEKIEGMGFSIAIEDVMSNIDTIEKGEKIERPFLGINMANVTDTTALYRSNISVPNDITSGVVIINVVEGSSAEGVLEKGDIITKINNKTISSSAYLRYELYKYAVGEQISITFIRNNETMTKKIALEKSN